MPLTEASPFLNHLTACSDCFNNFRELKSAAMGHRTLKLAYAAAVLLIMAILGIWWISAGRLQTYPQEAIVDLRPQSPVRGMDAPTGVQPPEISRFSKNITILLPVGSEGHYAVELKDPSGSVMATAQAVGVIKESAVELTFQADLRHLRPGVWQVSLQSDGGRTLLYQIRLK
jgi:hypothetical protein